MIKWLIRGVAVIVVLLVLLIVAVLLAPSFLPLDSYKGELAAEVQRSTGRSFEINGPISLSLLPRVALEMSDVGFGNPPGAAEKWMARLGKLQVRVDPFALLGKRIVVDSFVLVDPQIALAIDKEGRPNWQLTQPAASGAPAGKPAGAATGGGPMSTGQPPASPASPTAAGGGYGPEGVHLGDIRLVNGKITYSDARSGARQEVDKINATVSLPDLASPMKATGEAEWHGKTVALALDLAKPGELLGGKHSAVDAKLTAPALVFAFKGDMAMAPAFTLAGETDLDIASLHTLASWAGGTLPATSGGLEKLKIAGKLGLATGKASFSGAKIALDAINADGDLAVDTAGKRPRIEAKLAVDKLDLNPYLPPAGAAAGGPPAASAPAAAPTASGSKPTPPPAAAAAGWSDQPIDMSGLHAADGDFALSVGGIVFKKITIGKSAVTLQLKDGRLAVDLSEMALYQGSGTGKLGLDGAAAPPALQANFNLVKVEAEPFLKDLMGFDRVSGNANTEIAVTAHGKSEKELISTLDGKGAMHLADGAIRGIDIAALLRNPVSLVDAESQKDQKTAFADLGGSFTITNGVVENRDLALKSPVLTVTGAGKIDLPQRTVDYRIEPPPGLPVGLAVTGPWDHLAYRPQPTEALLKDPSKAVQGLKGLLQNPASQTPSGSTGTPSKPGDLLKGLLAPKP